MIRARGTAGALVLGVAFAEEGRLAGEYTGVLGEPFKMFDQLCMGRSLLFQQ
jgi:hypothetical protein